MSSSLVNLFFPPQAGGELTDFIIVLRTTEAVKTFSGNAHVSLGAGLSAAVGVVGRAVEADVRAGDGGYAACYTYSCSKGKFLFIFICDHLCPICNLAFSFKISTEIDICILMYQSTTFRIHSLVEGFLRVE
jgi:hypothetical protein